MMNLRPSIVDVYIATVYERHGVRITPLPEWYGYAKCLQNRLGWSIERTMAFVEWAVLSNGDNLGIPSLLWMWRRLPEWYAWRRETEQLSSRLTVLSAVAQADRFEQKTKGRVKR